MTPKAMLITMTLSAATATAVLAHGGATGIVKERMDGMMAMGKSLGVIADMFKGKRPYDSNLVANSADELKKHALRIEVLFPDSKTSRDGKATEALPEIWQKNREFLAIAAELAKTADELKTTALSGGQQDVRGVFAKVARTCSTCHQDFRKPKD